MPQEIVHIDLTAETGAAPKPTYTDAGVIGTATEQPEDAEFGKSNRYTNAADVADDYGEDSDVHVASQAIEQMGAQHWYVMVLEAVETTDELNDGDEAENTPILGDHTIETDTDAEMVFVTDTPVEEPDENEIALNTDTGEIAIGAEVTEPVELTYAYAADWTDLDNFTNPDNVGMANRHMSEKHIGVLDELVTWASGDDLGVVVAHENGNEFDDDEYALQSFQHTFSYVPSGDLMAVAHKSADDVASYILGQLAVNDPWFDPMYDGDGYPFDTDYYKKSLVGDPGTPGTFEGGDQENEEGNGNVIINKSGVTVLSNSLTTAGAASDYAYFDIGRTQTFLAAEIRRAVESARLRNDQIPFTADGKDIIENVVTETVDGFVGGIGQPLSEADISVPHPDDLSEDDIANRTWSGIDVDATLAGNVHQFDLELILGVA